MYSNVTFISLTSTFDIVTRWWTGVQCDLSIGCVLHSPEVQTVVPAGTQNHLVLLVLVAFRSVRVAVSVLFKQNIADFVSLAGVLVLHLSE